MKRYLIQTQGNDGRWKDWGYREELENAIRVIDRTVGCEMRVLELTPIAVTRMERSPVREVFGMN